MNFGDGNDLPNQNNTLETFCNLGHFLHLVCNIEITFSSIIKSNRKCKNKTRIDNLYCYQSGWTMFYI